MMTFQKEGTENFQAFLGSLYSQAGVADSLQKLRVKAWEHFLDLGLPSRKDDVYRYVKLRNFFAVNYEASAVSTITAAAIDPYILPESRQSVAVFVNGQFSPALSRLEAVPKRVVILRLAEATATFGSFLNSQWTKSLKDERDPFAAINAALHRDGLFLYFPPKTIFESPIQLLNVVDAGKAPMFIMPRVQVFAGTQSELSLVSTQAVLSGDQYVTNMVADFTIEDDARIEYIQATPNLGDGIWHFDALRAVLKRNSRLKTIGVTKGSATARFDYRVALTGENGEASLNGVWILAEKNEAHTHVLIDHQAPHCRSLQLFKGALRDTSHSAFEGKILVRQAAQKTEAFQLNNNLLLSDRANAESKPNLEIFADDVKASHGSTVGQLDNEQIFYMKTRGFSAETAKNLLVYGFCQEVIDMVSIPSLHDSMSMSLKN
ncbi:MAG: Fe-S cluster assembly protein SufD [Parachlamydiaceae bacterium]